MAIRLQLPQSETRLVIMLIVLFLLSRLPLLGYMPLVKDEAIYAMMIEEQADHPTLMPTFLGYPVSWKPPLFFWAYSLVPALPLPLEAGYRVPSLILSLITIPILFRTLRNMGASKPLSFLTLLIFTFSLPSVNPSVSLLTDALNFFFIASSLWLYTEPKFGPWRFILAGMLSFAAFFTKLVIAFMVPVLAFAYFYLNDRRTVKTLPFLISLIFVPAAYLANMALLSSAGMKADIYSSAVEAATPFWQIETQLRVFTGSATIFMIGAGIWFALSILGLMKHWKREKFMACWYAMIIFPLITGTFMVWYYLPVMPAVAYFAALILIRWDGGDKTDLFFMLFFSVALMLSISMIAYEYKTVYDLYGDEKEAGLILAGKENVAIVGIYAPTIVATKALTELRASGSILDFGWVVVPRRMDGEVVRTFTGDYWSDKYPLSQGTQDGFFADLFRKDTNITKFDYVVVTGDFAFSPPGSALIYNKSNITIYRVG
jgi:hypothetical protein